MLPAIVAQELRQTVLDYLRTTFSFQDKVVEEALFRFLTDRETGIFRGPYVQLRLPFRRAEEGEAEALLDVRPPFRPYRHQVNSWANLTTRNNHQPQHTLVTTGTGSGKTECFLYPVLDTCHRLAGTPGIKAIILYPMNALAADQARRIGKEIWNDPRLKGRVTAGMYTGSGRGEHRSMGPDYVITDREALRKTPPDILLTNYKMLDFLLLRPEDQPLWRGTGAESLKYLILDELHTYDGAQGSDVACLVRRLKAKLGVDAGGRLCCVGTSATLAGDDRQAKADLCEFARKLFGEYISEQNVLTEDRLALSEFLAEVTDYESLPKAGADDLIPAPTEDIAAYTERQAVHWFGSNVQSAVELSERLLRHSFLRTLLLAIEGKVVAWDDLLENIAESDPDFGVRTSEERSALLTGFLSLINRAKQLVGEREEPFLHCVVQIWVREMSRLMRRIAKHPEFFWRDDVPVSDSKKGLPAIYCSGCGATGWLTTKREQDPRVSDNHRSIYEAYFDQSRSVRYLFQGEEKRGEGAQWYIDPVTLNLEDDAKSTGVPILNPEETRRLTQKPPKHDKQWCPFCDSDRSLSLVGSQAASLSSVAIGLIYTSRFNEDKKLLAFTDSVQDASHRSGFFSARTYRFNLRTAIQTVLNAEGSGEIRLSEFIDKFVDYWRARMKDPEFVATFCPPDLEGLPEYIAYLREGKKAAFPRLMKSLWKRLAWEITMEYGFNARVGRTLDKVRCSTTSFKPEALKRLDSVAMVLRETCAIVERCSDRQLGHFLLGVLTRTKIRGGVADALLKGYGQNHGKWYFLTKEKNRLMSPFPTQSRLPRFLSLNPGELVFDSVIVSGERRNWFSDWAKRVLDRSIDAGTSNVIYREAIPRLAQAGLLEEIATGSNAFWIPAEVLTVTTNTAQVRSGGGHYLAVDAEQVELWEGMPSIVYREESVYDVDEKPAPSYYQRVYNSGAVKRVFAHEHTGIMNQDVRKRVEEEFKKGDVADAPNLLTCTPTLEMGIDVGDLSSTMVCSIPPTATNYLQRIGRAGRQSGNALILALANVQPHDLYFFGSPFEMIAGVVNPPGCFLDAPEMLKRQFLAFTMDTWCGLDGGGRLPRNVGLLLGEYGRGGFPNNLLKFLEERREQLLLKFLGLFSGHLSEEKSQRVAEYVTSGRLAKEVHAALQKTQAELAELRTLRERVSGRLASLRENPDLVENAEEAIREAEEEKDLLARLIRDTSEKYVLNLFTDEGLLPNYAFPETGVKLKSMITGIEKEDDEGKTVRTSESHEYLRGAGTAIRELAPFNTFYAEARKVVIDQIDTGGRSHSLVEEWRFCDVCSHMELASIHADASTCPVCGSNGWADAGQKRKLLKLQRVSSKANHYRSQTTDDRDDRERKRFLLHDFFDVRAENLGGGYADFAAPFGFEYLRNVTMREVNFGPSDVQGGTFHIKGQDVPEQGFTVCHDCGVARANGQTTPLKHRGWCYYNTQGRTEEWDRLFLYRQVESEAIRFLLPVSTFMADEKLATFKACVELGLRKKFRGNPGHLILRQYEEPASVGDVGTKRYLVLYDAVPGGTGYLKEFVNDPDAMRQLLEEAYRTLVSCGCRKDSEKDGCYRCVFAFQRQRELELISRDLGIKLLKPILDNWTGLQSVPTLAEVSLPDSLVESELEARFKRELLGFVSKRWGPTQQFLKGGRSAALLKVGNVEWELEEQVPLGRAEGVQIASKPDFLLTPRGDCGDALPVAIFTDGFAYHVAPEDLNSCLSDDIEKRSAITASGRYLVWSVTWEDVDELEKGTQPDGLSLMRLQGLTKGNAPAILERLKAGTDAPIPLRMLEVGSVPVLLSYLETPRIVKGWSTTIFATMLSGLKPMTSDSIEFAARSLTKNVSLPDDLELVPSQSGGQLGLLARFGFARMLVCGTASELGAKKTDALSVCLRLEDDQTSRATTEYRASWQSFLATWNIIQFLPGVQTTTARMISKNTSNSDGPAAPPAMQAAEAADVLPTEYSELLALVDASCVDLIKEAAQRGVPPPVVGYELVSEEGAVLADAELAWPSAKVAVILDGRADDRAAFEKANWKIKEVGALGQAGLDQLIDMMGGPA